MAQENHCRALQQKPAPSSAFEIDQKSCREIWEEMCHESWNRFLQKAIARSLDALVWQPDWSSFFANRVHRYGSTRARSRQMIKAPGTGGSLEVRRPTVWQMIPPLGMEALLPSVDASTTHYAASQTSRVTMMPGLKHLQFTQKVLESPSVETTGQRTEGDVGGDKERGQRDDLASESPCAHPHVQTLSTSRSSELELDIMNVYETQSERSGYNKSNSPGSPSSQYGCLLANEEDYVVEDESDWEEDNWDECGVSSSEE